MLFRLSLFFIALFMLSIDVRSDAAPIQFSQQGRGTLAQAPMNVQSEIPPAFILNIDDSNSMAFEMLFSIGDQALFYDNCRFNFFSYNSVFLNYSNLDTDLYNCIVPAIYYVYLYGQPGYNAGYNGSALPPIDQFGFARSSDFNTTFFNPFITYKPWSYPSPRNGQDRWPDADPANVRVDPRNPIEYGRLSASGYNQTYDLTNEYGRANYSDIFDVAPSMTLPDISGQGVYYFNNGYWSTASFHNDSYQLVPLVFSYFPATFYLKDSTPIPPGYIDTPYARPTIVDACGDHCNLRRYQILKRNYSSVEAYQVAIQNFANWFQYHRNRILSVISSLSDSIRNVENMRVGYFTINDPKNVTMYKLPEQRDDLYYEIDRLQVAKITRGNMYGATPNRNSVNFMAKQFKRTDREAPVQLACQKNAGLLFTDGYADPDIPNSTGLRAPVNVGNVDGSLGVPFADNFAGTIADVTAKFYLGDEVPLRQGNGFQPNAVPVPDQCKTLDPNSLDYKRLDCQTNLHMNFYAITLGAFGKIFGVNQAATADPFKNPPDWNSTGDPTQQSDPSAVDELWHATINSRGRYVSATSTDQVSNIMSQFLAAVGEGTVPSGALSLTGSRVGQGSLAVIPYYAVANNGTDWYSTLTAQVPSQVASSLAYTTVWEASARLPLANERNIIVTTPRGPTSFNASALTLDELCSDRVDNMSYCTEGDIGNLGINLEQAINYLRGDQTLENSTTTPLRKRTSLLGDIINASPIIAAPTDDYGYSSIYSTKDNIWDPYHYKSYLQDVKSKRPPVVYVGANDGMLHAFEGRSGRELFGYIPLSVIGHLGDLLFPYKSADGDKQKFQHRYYVDGPTIVSDVFVRGAWKTILLGSTGAGGKGVFALDVSNPLAFNERSLLWELNARDSNPQVADTVGYVLGKPIIVPVKLINGQVKWVAIFGNGYGSKNGIATLIIVDFSTNQTLFLPAQESNASGSANGLGNLVAIDRWAGDRLDIARSDGYADTVYAADQNGAVWRFDLRSLVNSTADNFFMPTLDSPFFIATDALGKRQPILGGMEVAAGPSNSVMVYFGTGSFSFLNDANDNSQQSFYGVLDPLTGASGLTRAALQQQTVSSSNNGTRSVSSTISSSTSQGWYVDLLSPAERVVSTPRLANGIVFFSTYQPSITSNCGTAGSNWLYGLNALTGAGSLSSVTVENDIQNKFTNQTGAISLTGGGTAPIRDVGVFSTPRLDGPSANGGDVQKQQCSLVIKTPGGSDMFMDRACGRQSWRQIK